MFRVAATSHAPQLSPCANVDLHTRPMHTLGGLLEHTMLHVGPFFRGLLCSLDKEIASNSAVFCMLGLAVGLNKQPSFAVVFCQRPNIRQVAGERGPKRSAYEMLM